jgi:Tol biopolymer transport system component
MASDGSGEIRDVIRNPWEKYQPTFTPEGRHTLFENQERGLVSAIWIMDLHGTNKRKRRTLRSKPAGRSYKQIALASNQMIVD